MPNRRSWNHNIHYHGIVLKATPPKCIRALDVGCGDGLLASELAERCQEVVAIDVDAPTLARARTAHGQPNLLFVEADVMSYPFDQGGFDCVVSIAALHHLPLAPALERFKQLLRPGGVLALVGRYRLSTPADLVWALVAMPFSWWLRLTNNYKEVVAPIRDPDETLAEINRNVTEILPGAAIERQLLFRYALIWRKPSG